ncbi:MAG: hypothetical protein ACHQIO_23585, partial [Nevskiales bacterium]
ANSVATLTLTLGCIGFGMLADRFGPAPVLSIGSAMLLLSTYGLYLGVAQNPGLLIPLYALAGLFVGIVGVIPLVLVRNFPPAVRFSGISFSYNVAYAIFGGFTPPLVAMLGKVSPLGPAHYVAAMCVIGLLMGIFGARQPVSALQVNQPGATA